MSATTIDPRHTALVIIDLQNDFLAPDGAYARGGAVSAAAQALPPRVATVAKALKAAGGMVVCSQFTLGPDAQGEPKVARGYMPATTQSALSLAHPGGRLAIAESLEHERREVAEVGEYLEGHAPFRKSE